MGKLNWKERWGRERKENERREIIRGMKGREKIDIPVEEPWERTMFEKWQINTTARKIIMYLGTKGRAGL